MDRAKEIQDQIDTLYEELNKINEEKKASFEQLPEFIEFKKEFETFLAECQKWKYEVTLPITWYPSYLDSHHVFSPSGRFQFTHSLNESDNESIFAHFQEQMPGYSEMQAKFFALQEKSGMDSFDFAELFDQNNYAASDEGELDAFDDFDDE